MSAAEKLTSSISEPLTWAEICEEYPDQWVCLVLSECNYEIRSAERRILVERIAH
jgi:hypothetical protein